MSMVFKVNLYSLLISITSAAELTELAVADHSQRVAYITLNIGQAIGMPEKDLQKLVMGALLHDIGISSSREKLKLTDLNVDGKSIVAHCQRGAELLKRSRLLAEYAPIVYEHHSAWTEQPDIYSPIIHLSDRTEIVIDKNKYILWQHYDILRRIERYSGRIFDPELVDVLRHLTSKPSFWLDLATDRYKKVIAEFTSDQVTFLTFDELESIAFIYAEIIDDKSPFTFTHSRGVCEMALAIGAKAGFSDDELRLLKIAALLHDLGKLAIPDEILDYPDQLTHEQMLYMQQHTYHTYHLLDSLGPEARQIRNWAAFHHEKLDGSGYPFGLNHTQLDTGARIMAVADISQALQENRPYRKKLPQETINRILMSLVRDGKIDEDLTHLAIEIMTQKLTIE